MKNLLNDLRRELLDPMTWLVLAAFIAVFTFGQLLDSPNVRSTEMNMSTDLLQAQSDVQESMRREAAGTALCLGLVGESTPLWDEDGNLSACQPRKGKKVVL